MEVQDGFIVGVYNYCDRWCERCAYTSRCRVFSDDAEREFEADHGPLTEPMADRQARELAEHVSRWEKRWGLDLAKIEEEAEKNPLPEPPDIQLRHLELHERAKDFGDRVWRWVDGRSPTDAPAADAVAVIAHFAFLIAAKVHRSLRGLADDDGARDFPPDFEGSAKVALVGMDRSIAAWQILELCGYIPATDVRTFVEELEWLRRELEAAVPAARSFVRPAFDEPDAVRLLDALEG
jgi:hypothetical protein